MRQDIRQSLRSLIRSPGFSAASVLTLALGIGANSMIFSLVNAVLLRPLPYFESERLMSIWPGDRLSQEVLAVLNDKCRSFQGVSGSAPSRLPLRGRGQAEEFQGAAVSANHFKVLGAQPSQGRSFAEQDGKPGAPPTVIVSHGLWQRRFGADPALLGAQIRLGAEERTVIGIMDAGYRPLEPEWEYWVPLIMDPSSPVYSGRTWLTLVGRIKPQTAPLQAQSEVQGLAKSIAQGNPEIYSPNWVRRAAVVPLHSSMVQAVRPILWALLAAVGFVFLIACSNLANLLLARGASRSREIAIRSALGAGRTRLVLHLLSESVLLGLGGGLAGLAAAIWALQALAGSFPVGLPLSERIAVDLRVCGFTLLFSLLAGVAFGLGPALRACRPDLQWMLAEGRLPASAGLGQGRWGGILVAVQAALALVLIVGAALMLKSLWKLGEVDPGFEAEPTLSMQLNPPWERYSSQSRISAFYHRVMESVKAVPGVVAVGAVHQLPLTGGSFNFTYFAQDNPVPPGSPRPSASVRLIMPGYFESMGIPVQAGRSLARRDGSEAPAVGLINQSLARQLWPDQDAVGKQIRFFSPDEPPFTVIGVVGDVRQFNLQAAAVGEIYRPIAQYAWSSMYLTVRAGAQVAGLVPSLRQAVWRIDRDVAISRVRPMQEVVSRSIADTRFYTLLLTIFAGLALGLGSLGVYGVTSYAASSRRHEIGVRMALGAGAGKVQRQILSRGLRPVAAGVLIGLPSAAAATRALSSQLFEVAPFDGEVFAMVAILLICVAAAAVYLPARRASRVDPLSILRNA